MAVDWFEHLVGFRERSYEKTRSNLEIDGRTLRSRINHQSYSIGHLETPSLGELRARAKGHLPGLAGRFRVANFAGDARIMHSDSANENALFQVASQFNLLEMTGPNVTPEDGVSRYSLDPTQGPACAIAAGAATIYRNYFAKVHGHTGQTRERQIDCLADLGSALGNDKGALWEMRNGYALCTEQGLAEIDRKLDTMNLQEIDRLRDSLRIGLHWNIEVTDAAKPHPFVSQAFCSALPVSYTPVPTERWSAFATLILEGAYEATLWAAVLNAQENSSNLVFLTQLGGGAFGNEPSWIHNALRRGLMCVKKLGLDVRLVSYGRPDQALERIATECE